MYSRSVWSTATASPAAPSFAFGSPATSGPSLFCARAGATLSIRTDSVRNVFDKFTGAIRPLLSAAVKGITIDLDRARRACVPSPGALEPGQDVDLTGSSNAL